MCWIFITFYYHVSAELQSIYIYENAIATRFTFTSTGLIAQLCTTQTTTQSREKAKHRSQPITTDTCIESQLSVYDNVIRAPRTHKMVTIKLMPLFITCGFMPLKLVLNGFACFQQHRRRMGLFAFLSHVALMRLICGVLRMEDMCSVQPYMVGIPCYTKCLQRLLGFSEFSGMNM